MGGSRFSLLMATIAVVGLGSFQNCSHVDFASNSPTIDNGQGQGQGHNTLNTLQPALVVRGISCITCHSSIGSNIVTDYGYGNPWYFDSTSFDSFYIDRVISLPSGGEPGLQSVSLARSSQIMVPAGAALPAAAKQLFPGPATLAEFIQSQFAVGNTNLPSQVKEVSNIKINLPTAARIRQVFGNPAAASSVYKPDSANSPAIAGLNFKNNIFVISSLICDGDLYLGSAVFLQNAEIQSINGCRIYSTGSVFIEGSVQSMAYQGSPNHNVQILSAESIWAGVGKLWKSGQFCERDGVTGAPTGFYSEAAATPQFPDIVQNAQQSLSCASAQYATSPECDTFNFRADKMIERNTFSRAYDNASLLNALFGTPDFSPILGSVAIERANIEAAVGISLYDASCGPTGRNVSFSRLLLAAPYVNSRYYGNFSGAVVAEAALMSLSNQTTQGNFQFQFDPIFKNVSIFSLLENDELVSF